MVGGTKMQKGTTQTSDTLLRQDKDISSTNQLQTIFSYLQNHIATASMVTVATGVPQKCITRYKRDLENAGMLWEIERKYCQHTGFKAWYLTTNPALAPKRPEQLSLFDNQSPQPAIKKQYQLFERITEEGAWYEVTQCNAFPHEHLLKIQPFQWDGKRSAPWPKVFEGNLEECDQFVTNLINSGKPC